MMILMSLYTIVDGIFILRYIGSDALSSLNIVLVILLYVEFLFNAFCLGFSIGIGPIIGYNFGAKQKDELKLVYNTSFIFVIISSFVLTIISLLSMKVLVGIFIRDQDYN